MKFQYILLTLFGVIGVVAVIAFAKLPTRCERDNSCGGNSGIAAGTYTIWGTYPQEGMNAALKSFNERHQKEFTVQYIYKDPKSFDQDIVEALASRRNPDILLLPNDLVLRHADKIEKFPYASIPAEAYMNGFIQAAEVYLEEDGIVAVPFAVDPMMMYWNRDLFSNASLTLPPKYWEEFLTMAPLLTTRDKKTGDILQSAIPFGEYSNIVRGKEVLSTLFLQVGNKIVERKDGHVSAALGKQNGSQFVPDQDVVSIFRFFMSFSNPLVDIYSWNLSKSSALNEFINGNLAVYFDYSSAYNLIRDKNPHLNFAAAQMPIPKKTTVETTYAAVHGLTVLKDSWNKAGALNVATLLLSEPDVQKSFSDYFGLPPVRRDLLGVRPNDATLSTFFGAAIRSRTWLDPKPSESDSAFRSVVEAASSGRTDSMTSISQLHSKLNALLAPYY